jgi:hypothetical protein
MRGAAQVAARHDTDSLPLRLLPLHAIHATDGRAMSLTEAIALVNTLLRRNDDQRDTMHGVLDNRTAFAVTRVLAHANRSLERALQGRRP